MRYIFPAVRQCSGRRRDISSRDYRRESVELPETFFRAPFVTGGRLFFATAHDGVSLRRRQNGGAAKRNIWKGADDDEEEGKDRRGGEEEEEGR